MERTEIGSLNDRAPFPDEMERNCVAVVQRRNVLYLYPIDKNVLAGGAKVMTRDGRLVKHVRLVTDSKGDSYYTGELDKQLLRWDSAGRFAGPYRNHANDLFIPERYFDPEWKLKIHLTNSEWALQYERPHPNVKKPEKRYNEEFRKYYGEED